MNDPRRPLPRTQPALHFVCLGQDARSLQESSDVAARLRLLGLDCQVATYQTSPEIAPEPLAAAPAFAQAHGPSAGHCHNSIVLLHWPKASTVTAEEVAGHLQRTAERFAGEPRMMFADAEQALSIGPGLVVEVEACLPANSSAREILRAIKVVQMQGCYFAPAIKQHLLTPLIEAGSLADHSSPLQDGLGLTPREREIWALVEQGLTSRAIADQLEISVRTVDAHRRNLRQKIGI